MTTEIDKGDWELLDLLVKKSLLHLRAWLESEPRRGSKKPPFPQQRELQSLVRRHERDLPRFIAGADEAEVHLPLQAIAFARNFAAARAAVNITTHSPNPWVRAAGLQMATAVRPHRFVHDFERATADPSGLVRLFGVQGLGGLPRRARRARVPLLLDLLCNTSEETRVRTMAIQVVCTVSRANVQEVLRKLAETEQDAEVRAKAAQGVTWTAR